MHTLFIQLNLDFSTLISNSFYLNSFLNEYTVALLIFPVTNIHGLVENETSIDFVFRRFLLLLTSFIKYIYDFLGTFHLRGLALQLSRKNPSFALQNNFYLRCKTLFICADFLPEIYLLHPSIAQITCNFLIMIMIFLVIFI